MCTMKRQSERLREILGLETHPVAVFLVGCVGVGEFDGFQRLTRHRYCQALMQARAGQSVVLLPDALSCPAAAAAFGFKARPVALANGKSLTGFGIVRQVETGRRMFQGMTTLEMGAVQEIALCPLGEAEREPDVVVVEGTPEQLMWLLLADLNREEGERRVGNTAVLQATCVDATIIPYVDKRLNFSFGCYGCREATDIGTHETVLGFHGSLLGALMEELEHLASRAIPRSRARKAFHALEARQSDEGELGQSPFQD